MRVVVIGQPRSRARLRDSLAHLDIEVVSEAASLGEARIAEAGEVDAYVVAPDEAVDDRRLPAADALGIPKSP